MKLRGKIIAIFVAIIIFILSAIGISFYITTQNTINDMTDEKIESTVEASAHDIGDQFEIYKNIIYVVGHDDRLYGDYPDAVKAATIQRYAEAFGFTSGNVLNIYGKSVADGTDYSDRLYVQRALNGEVNISSVTESKLTGNYGFSIAGPLVNDKNAVVGVVYFRMEVDQLLEVIHNMKISDNSSSYIIDMTGTIIVHDDYSMINNVSVADFVDFDSLMSDAESSLSGVTSYEKDEETFRSAYSMIAGTDGWFLIASAPESDFNGPVKETVNILVISEIVDIIIGIIGALLLAAAIAGPVNKIKDNLIKLSEGDFSGSVMEKKGKDEIAQLSRATASLQKSVQGVILEANDILGRMSQYDLTSADMSNYPGEFNTMSESVNRIKQIMNNIIKNVQEAVANVGVGAGEIADATSALSQGTVAQASSLQQVVVDIESVAEQTEKNTENGALVNERLQHLDELIKTSNDQMAELRKAVLEIEEMSGDIQKIVHDIDSISFQTNILALNASVEAARAGENGKGFAVVADEVGNLANKSGESSKKTAELIDKCIATINRAKKCADQSFESLAEIVTNSDEISNAFAEITIANAEQMENTKSIKGEVDKISDVVQTNTATAEQTAASTQVLSSEAENLNGLIRKFRV